MDEENKKNLTEKVVHKSGRFTGKTIQFVKGAPTRTTKKSKALLGAFVEGVKSTNS